MTLSIEWMGDIVVPSQSFILATFYAIFVSASRIIKYLEVGKL